MERLGAQAARRARLAIAAADEEAAGPAEDKAGRQDKPADKAKDHRQAAGRRRRAHLADAVTLALRQRRQVWQPSSICAAIPSPARRLAMRKAMAEAEVGDDVYGEDPTGASRGARRRAARVRPRCTSRRDDGEPDRPARPHAPRRRSDHQLERALLAHESGSLAALLGLQTQMLPTPTFTAADVPRRVSLGSRCTLRRRRGSSPSRHPHMAAVWSGIRRSSSRSRSRARRSAWPRISTARACGTPRSGRSCRARAGTRLRLDQRLSLEGPRPHRRLVGRR